MTHKLKELGAMLLILTVMGAVAFLYAGPRDHVEQDYSQTCD